MRVLRIFTLIAAFAGTAAGAHADDIDALFLAGYWCGWEDKTKTENVPRNRTFVLVRQVEAANAAAEPNFTEYLVDVTGDVRGQRLLLLQKQKNADGSTCKTDCQLARRIVNRDLLEPGEWNATTGVFKSANPREYIYRCER